MTSPPHSSLPDISRYGDWLARLAARGGDDVRVVWVGGSAATGGYDEWSAVEEECATWVDQVRQCRATAEWLVNRALRRGQLPEAVSSYLTFALGGLVRLLRAQHCPWRHDFGLRYLHTDLPADVAGRVDALLPLPGNPDLTALSAACFAWTDELLAGQDQRRD